MKSRTSDLIDRLMATTFETLDHTIREDDVGVLLGAMVSYCGNLCTFLALQSLGPDAPKERLLETTQQFLTGVSTAFGKFCAEQRKVEEPGFETRVVSHGITVDLGTDKPNKDLLN